MNAEAYAGAIREKADLRRLQRVCSEAVTRADGTSGSAEDLLDGVESQLLDIRSGRNSERHTLETDLDDVFERMHEEQNRTEDLLGLPSGLRALDLVTRGFQPGQLTIVGAKSGVGKTSLMVQAAIASCLQGIPVLLFSLEMTRAEVLRRILCAVSGVPFPQGPRYEVGEYRR